MATPRAFNLSLNPEIWKGLDLADRRTIVHQAQTPGGLTPVKYEELVKKIFRQAYTDAQMTSSGIASGEISFIRFICVLRPEI